jgi:FkbM family methyltransferase
MKAAAQGPKSASAMTKTALRTLVPRTLRNWLRSPSKSAEWLWDCARFSAGATKIAPILPDWGLRCHPYAYKIVIRDQMDDPEQGSEFRNFVSNCSGSMLLFDVGAHFGVFSLVAAHFGGRAVAVDPSPTATRMIGVQAALNGLADRIEIVRAAVGDTVGSLNLLGSGVFSDGYFKMVKGRSRRELTEFPATRVDELSTRFGAPTHIKVDVEGYEAAVLRGARQTLKDNSPILFLELHNEMVTSEGGDPHALLDMLDRLGYTTFSTDGEVIRRQAIVAKPIIRILAKRPL